MGVGGLPAKTGLLLDRNGWGCMWTAGRGAYAYLDAVPTECAGAEEVSESARAGKPGGNGGVPLRWPRRPALTTGGVIAMGLMSGLTGNAEKLDSDKALKEFGRLLGPGEEIHAAYVLIRDSFIFTNRRLILVDKQGMTGKKVDYTSVPYRHVHRFSVETAGHFDLDAELKIWVAGQADPIKQEFRKGVDIYEVQAILAQHTAS